MRESGLYVNPKQVDRLDDCYFYHTMDLPGVGTVKGNWDLREGMDKYLGNFDFLGKRVLDIGAASGALSFAIEQKGARVVSFDLSENEEWDMVPYAKWEEYLHIANERKAIIRRLNNSYWFSHRLLDSRAKFVHGSVYHIPHEIGEVDVSVYGCILLHLRDPFLALQSGLRLTCETVVITEFLRKEAIESKKPYMLFLPDSRIVEPKDTWWDLKPEIICRMISVLGFEEAYVSYHSQKYEGASHPMFTVVGRRTCGRPFMF